MVVRLVDRDPIDPGLQGTTAAKVADVPKDLKKNLLDNVAGIARVAHQARDQRVNRLLEAEDKRLVRVFAAQAQVSYQGIFLDLGSSSDWIVSKPNGWFRHGSYFYFTIQT
jgi:hypothetical protein